MIGETYTPPMYRDVMSSCMPTFELDPTMMGMGTMYGGMGMLGGFYNTNYLGGVSLRPNLSRDTVNIIRTKDKEAEKGMANFGKVLLGVIAFGVASAFLKGKKPPAVGGKKWYNPISWFKK